jgi:deazaflavin-dependent oxidoreductase (nitroreductase family)
MDRPAVQDAPPPKAVLRLINPLLVALLRSPLHRLASKRLMLLTITGHKSGRTYTLPVGRHETPDGTFVLSAGGNWRHNLRGGAEVRVTLDRRERTAYATLEEDSIRAAEVFKGLLDRAGARAVGVKVNVTHSPTPEEIKPALANRGVAYLKLAD